MKGKWASTDAVQDRILDAAVATFRERGYAESKLTDIVQLAGVSIGSIYHHFGSKDDLYIACFERLRADLRETIGLEGEMPPHGTWEEAYLSTVWSTRETCSIFVSADSPWHFDASKTLAIYYADLGEHLARILGAIMVEAMRILCECPQHEAERVINSTTKLLSVVRDVRF